MGWKKKSNSRIPQLNSLLYEPQHTGAGLHCSAWGQGTKQHNGSHPADPDPLVPFVSPLSPLNSTFWHFCFARWFWSFHTEHFPWIQIKKKKKKKGNLAISMHYGAEPIRQTHKHVCMAEQRGPVLSCFLACPAQLTACHLPTGDAHPFPSSACSFPGSHYPAFLTKYLMRF